MDDTGSIESDPYRDDDGLADEEGGRAEEPGEGFCLEGEPIIPKNWGEVEVRGVKAKMVFLRGGGVR